MKWDSWLHGLGKKDVSVLIRLRDHDFAQALRGSGLGLHRFHSLA